jgi:hypothetical protein
MKLEQVNELINRKIEYVPRGTSTVKEGIRTFTIVSITRAHKHPQSGNPCLWGKVLDHDDCYTVTKKVKGYTRKDGRKVKGYKRTTEKPKEKPRCLNIDLIQ